MNFDLTALTTQIKQLNDHLTQLETFVPWLLAALGIIALGLWTRR